MVDEVPLPGLWGAGRSGPGGRDGPRPRQKGPDPDPGRRSSGRGAVFLAAIARREGITRARVTQVMGLLRLAPEIHQQVLSLPDMVRRRAITERALRPIAQKEDHAAQRSAFFVLLEDPDHSAASA